MKRGDCGLNIERERYISEVRERERVGVAERSQKFEGLDKTGPSSFRERERESEKIKGKSPLSFSIYFVRLRRMELLLLLHVCIVDVKDDGGE